MPNPAHPLTDEPRPKRFWSVDDVAKYVCRSRRTVERWLYARKLPHHRLPSGQIVFKPSRIRQLVEGDELW